MSRVIEIPNLQHFLDRYVAGESEKKLSEEIGVGRGVFRRRLLKAGITPRSYHAAQKLAWASRTDPVERAKVYAAAHAAVRGTKKTTTALANAAAGREAACSGVSAAENIMVDLLRESGISDITQQKAVGVYNVDIALNEFPIAVEIFSGGWHSSGRHFARHIKRFRYLLDQGWCAVVIWVDGRRYPLDIRAAEYVVSLTKRFSTDNPPCRAYRVISGDGETLPPRKSHLNTRALIKSIIEPEYASWNLNNRSW